MSNRILVSTLLLLIASVAPATRAQAPAGTITGTVTDDTGAVIPSARVTITNRANGAVRELITNADGLYSAPALPPGEYDVRVEVQGFRTVVRSATVQAGATTTVVLALSLGESKEVVNVEAATAQINYDSHTVQGVIPREAIQDLPLNGRSFVQLATLEPGITASTGTVAQFNTLFSVTTLGQSKMLYTIDGGNINDEVEGGNFTSMNFSQEIVQEFQMSSVNFDLSTGITATGAINVVTRSGGNDFHGAGYFYYRDHNMAAYPALKRSALAPNPFFQRKNPGYWVGGPIVKDKLFFFFNQERMWQTQVYTFQPDLPSISGLAAIFPAPYHNDLITARFDYRISPKHSLFARYSHDGNQGEAPPGNTAELSAFDINRNWSDQSALGVTSVLTPTLVNEFRFIFHYWQNNNLTEPPENCKLPCIGGGLPSIVSMIGSSVFVGGLNSNAPQQHESRSYELGETLSWQKRTHRFRFGGDWEHMNTIYNPWDQCVQGCLSVYSPETVTALVGAANVARYFPFMPARITSTADLLNLPVYNTISRGVGSGLGIGNGTWPGLYHQDQERQNDRPQFFVTDTWNVTPNLTLNMGLRYTFETGLFMSDIAKPAFLAPIFGPDLHATPSNKFDFSPAFGFAWALGKDHKTVIRGGAGLYWDTEQLWHEFKQPAYIGPVGNGRVTVSASVLTNPFDGIVNFNNNQPLAAGEPLPLNSLTNMTLGQFIQIYNAQIPGITQRISPTPPRSGPFSVSGIDLIKQAVELYPPNYPLMRSYQTSIGLQRDLGHDMVLTADWARRQYENVDYGEVDENQFARFINRIQTPVIPICSPAQVFVPGQECSTGNITVWSSNGRTVYNGLLVKVQKRFSKRYQFIASYALQKQLTIASVVNSEDVFAGYGPNLARHNLNVAGVVDLPAGFKLSVNTSVISRTPVEPIMAGIDINGAGNTNFPLSEAVPDVPYNCFNAGCGKADLAAAVAKFNATYAGTKDARGATIPAYILPKDYQFGDPTFNTDTRLTKEFAYKERLRFQVFGEFFNVFNIANLAGYTYVLNPVNPNPARQAFTFGQPTTRFTQVFGSGGPRAIQAGARISF